jgi:hypothetical protein
MNDQIAYEEPASVQPHDTDGDIYVALMLPEPRFLIPTYLQRSIQTATTGAPLGFLRLFGY